MSASPLTRTSSFPTLMSGVLTSTSGRISPTQFRIAVRFSHNSRRKTVVRLFLSFLGHLSGFLSDLGGSYNSEIAVDVQIFVFETWVMAMICVAIGLVFSLRVVILLQFSSAQKCLPYSRHFMVVAIIVMTLVALESCIIYQVSSFIRLESRNPFFSIEPIGWGDQSLKARVEPLSRPSHRNKLLYIFIISSRIGPCVASSLHTFCRGPASLDSSDGRNGSHDNLRSHLNSWVTLFRD